MSTSVLDIVKVLPKWFLSSAAILFVMFLGERFYLYGKAFYFFGFLFGPPAVAPGVPLPYGAFILSERPCPPGFYEDITQQMSGRYVIVDDSAKGAPTTAEGDGGHVHAADGEHAHNVTGRTAPLGGGERRGGSDRHAAHMNNTVEVKGTAQREGSAHTHGGGPHEHRRVGVRLCKVKGGTAQEGADKN